MGARCRATRLLGVNDGVQTEDLEAQIEAQLQATQEESSRGGLDPDAAREKARQGLFRHEELSLTSLTGAERRASLGARPIFGRQPLGAAQFTMTWWFT